MVRTAAHERTASWWPQVRTITIEPNHNQAEAERAEQAAIRNERPKYNRTHSAVPHEPRPAVASQARIDRDKRLAAKGRAPFDVARVVEGIAALRDDDAAPDDRAIEGAGQ
jgi:hypothetical protein